MSVAYLSRIWMNPRRAQSQRMLRDRNILHAAVLAGIPRQPVTERVLWRLDAVQPHRPALLAVTRSRPSWEHFVEQAGWPGAAEPDDPQGLVREYRPFLDRLGVGQQFAFRLTANPVRASRSPEQPVSAPGEGVGSKGVRRSAILGHRTVESQLRWLTSRTDRWGFALPPAASSEAMGEPVPDVRVTGRERVSFPRGRGEARVTLEIATYEGRLEVHDPVVLADALLAGMGRAKAYGCGLMTLAPLPAPKE